MPVQLDEAVDLPNPAGAHAHSHASPPWLNCQFIDCPLNPGKSIVVFALWEQNRFNEITDHIEAGDSEWIALAAQIAPGTDAAPAEELAESLAYALPINSVAVLSVLNDKIIPLSPEFVCNANFDSHPLIRTESYVQRTKEAIEAIKDDGLILQKTACLSELNKAQKAHEKIQK